MAGTATSQIIDAKAKRLKFDAEFIDVYLTDGRMLRIPLDWYPHLEWATPKQRKNYELIFDGEAIEWPDIDEAVSVAGLLRGNKAPPSKAYLTGKWSDEIERERIERVIQHKASGIHQPKQSPASARDTSLSRNSQGSQSYSMIFCNASVL